jgi:DNA-binding NtrC family response regulator
MLAQALLHCGIVAAACICFIGRFISRHIPSRSSVFMQKCILVVNTDKKQCRELVELIEKERYCVSALHSLQNLETTLEENKFQAVIFDIDTVQIDNRTVRKLTLKFPEVYFFCLSVQPFHPELKDAICYHIYACLNKPVDEDELFYFLRSIYENETDSNNEFAQ